LPTQLRLVESGQRKVLSFDIENRPLSYWYGDVTTSEITCIAWSWNNPKKVEVRALPEVTPEEMLRDFVEAYAAADLITGHYIRRHDLPLVNAGLMEYGMPILPSKKTSDTKLDLAKRAGQPATLEHLGAMLGIKSPKFGMSQKMWREANRLTDPDAIELTKKRCSGDVSLQILVRNELHRLGLLKTPSYWHSVAGGVFVPES
jgi:hypothetical protein